MTKRYFSLLSKTNEDNWVIEFGDYDRSVVEDEMNDMRDHSHLGKIKYKIVSTGDKQSDIDAHVAKLNAKPRITAHEFLTNEGAYVHEHIDAEFDDGDAENGPGTWGCDEYDVYSGDSHNIILQRGKQVDMTEIDWDEFRFFEGQQS